MNRTNKSRKNCWQERKTRLPVQRMYDTYKDVFAFSGTGIVPSPEKIERLRAFLGILLCGRVIGVGLVWFWCFECGLFVWSCLIILNTLTA
ncbi:hypothetical protein ACOSQ3_014108 [Xanthoceras sorbifolium]